MVNVKATEILRRTPNLSHDDNAALAGLVVAPLALARDCGPRVCGGVVLRRPRELRILGLSTLSPQGNAVRPSHEGHGCAILFPSRWGKTRQGCSQRPVAVTRLAYSDAQLLVRNLAQNPQRNPARPK